MKPEGVELSWSIEKSLWSGSVSQTMCMTGEQRRFLEKQEGLIGDLLTTWIKMSLDNLSTVGKSPVVELRDRSHW